MPRPLTRRPPAAAGLLLLVLLLLPALPARPARAEHLARLLPPAFGPGSPVPDVPRFPPMALTERLRACLPERLHPVSRQFLELWLQGSIGTRTFRRFFHMPNSDYLPVGECLLRERTLILAESHAASQL